MRSWLGIAALGLVTLAMGTSLAAGKAAPRAAANGNHNWNTRVQALPNGAILIGNPDAEVKLVEFVRYTCSHCAAFELQGGDALRIGLIATGKGSLELRSFMNNPVDIAASLLVQCGAPVKFPGNSTMFLRSQAKWSAIMEHSTPAQRQRWLSGTFVARTRAMASDLGFYDLMASRGYDRMSVDRCLANQPLAQSLAALSQDAAENVKIAGTPSFMINGELQDETFNWATLQPKLMALTR